jgi:hypothetical protein
VRDEQRLSELAAGAEQDDVDVWRALLKRFGLTRFCHQVCHFLCRASCKHVCVDLCRRPVITRVSSIPTPSQFSNLGLGTGPGIPPVVVPPPPPRPPNNPPLTAGNHPIGAWSNIKGQFNFAGATQYKIEVKPVGGGAYTPILNDVWGWDGNQPMVWEQRSPCASPGGWFNILDAGITPCLRGLHFSDGAPTGEVTLTDWLTTAVPDGDYNLRLVVRDAAHNQRFSAPQHVRVDNTPPPIPVIQLELLKPDGTLVPLKCGHVNKGDGLIRITIEATDPHFSQCTVEAHGNSSLVVPIVAVPDPPGSPPAIPLSKNYNYDVTDTGYPTPTSFIWDPWSDPNIVPCCYLIRIDITDRAVLNNTWSGGHARAGWEALGIGV